MSAQRRGPPPASDSSAPDHHHHHGNAHHGSMSPHSNPSNTRTQAPAKAEHHHRQHEHPHPKSQSDARGPPPPQPSKPVSNAPAPPAAGGGAGPSIKRMPPPPPSEHESMAEPGAQSQRSAPQGDVRNSLAGRGRGRGGGGDDNQRGRGRGGRGGFRGRVGGGGFRGRGRGRGEGRGGGFRGRGRGRGFRNYDDAPRPPPAPLSTKKFCCDGVGSQKSVYFERFEKGELNPLLLHPRLKSLGVVLVSGKGDGKDDVKDGDGDGGGGGVKLEAAHPPVRFDFAPDRRGIPRIVISCNGADVQSITACLDKISTFIGMQHRANRRVMPVRVTCRVNQLHTDRMNFHLHYDREPFMQLIEQNPFNLYAFDIGSRKELEMLLKIIDVFKHRYAERGCEIHTRQLKQLVPDATAVLDKNSPESDRVSHVLDIIKENGFTMSNNECRLWSTLGAGNDGKIHLDIELARTIKLVTKLKSLVKPSVFFNEMRFGLDLESKTAFIEIRPRSYFRMLRVCGTDCAVFVRTFSDVQTSRAARTVKRLWDLYGEKEVKKLSAFALDFFGRNPEMFEWHEKKH